MIKIHIASHGNDRGDGSVDRPFATPRRAQMVARKAKRAVQVVVQDGVYELDAPLVFTPADNGQRWSATAGARPVFSGGRRLTGWTVGTHAGLPVWTLELPEVRSGAWHFTQLWVDGQRRSRPRLPKTGFFRFTGMDGQPDSGMNWLIGPDRAEYPEGSLVRFRNLEDVNLISYQLWFDTHHHIKELDEARRVVHFYTKSIGSLCDESGQFARFFLMNVGEALTEPGEWYLDRTTGTLTYLPLPGETPETVVVVAPRLAEIVRFQGTRTTAVADVVLENLGMAHNEWSRAIDFCGTVQAAFDVPGAVIFERAERCILYGCELAHLAGYGVEMLAGSQGNVVAASTIRDLGAGAVKIGHEDLANVHSGEVGSVIRTAARWLRPQTATVVDCHLHDGGHIYPSAVGIWIGNAGQNRIQHNHIHHFAYTGISCGWSWGYAPTRTWDNRIEHNHIHHINHRKVLSDNGGIYTLGIQPGSTVVGNHVHDISSYHYGGQGIYPDEGSSGILFEANCIHHVAYYGYSVHYGRYLTLRNNILMVMGDGVLDPGRVDLSFGQKLESNLMVWVDCNRLKSAADWHPMHCETRGNLVWCDSVGGVPWFRGTLAAEQAAGRWQNSVEADPLFADARSGDFALRADSPAFAVGFRPFDWSQAGVRKCDERPVSWSDYRLPSAPPRALALASLEAGALTITDDGAELPLQVTLTNPSEKPVRGRWTVRMGDGSLAVCEPGPKLSADLAPGSSVVKTLRVHLKSALGRQWVQVRGDERTCFSGAAPVMVQPTVILPVLPEGSDLSLSEGLDVSVDHTGVPILRGWAAIVGEFIALDLTVCDALMRVDRELIWKGASLEVFADAEPMPGVIAIPKQWNVIPPDAHGSGEVRPAHQQVGPPPKYDIQCVPGGWRACLRLPLADLGLAPQSKGFRFDVICNVASPVQGQNLLRLPRWGVPNNWANSSSLVRVKIDQSVSEKNGRGTKRSGVALC